MEAAVFPQYAPPERLERFDTMTDLWTDASGTIWAGTAENLFQVIDDRPELSLQGPVMRFIGQSTGVRLWALLAGGDFNGELDDEGWYAWGPQDGWRQPFPQPISLSPGVQDGIIEGPDGRLWLATGMDELRVYDPQDFRWSTLSHADLGFPDPAVNSQGIFLTDVVISDAGRVWAGACEARDDTLAGLGVARLAEDGTWGVIPHTVDDSNCVMDMELNQGGVVLVGSYGGLLVYDPMSGNWEKEPIPGLPGARYLVNRLDYDPLGNLWVEVVDPAPDSPYTSRTVLIRKPGGEWSKVLGPGGPDSYDIAFAADGTGYLTVSSTLLYWEDGYAREIGTLESRDIRLAVDGTGQAYAAAVEGECRWLYRIPRPSY
jgi:hypothetical protein